MQNKSYIKLTLFKVQINSSSNTNDLNNIKLSFIYDNQQFETDKISSNNINYNNGKCFYFISHNKNENQSIKVLVISSYLMFFNKPLAEIDIKIANDYNDQKKWYEINIPSINSKLKLLISIFGEFSNYKNNNTSLLEYSLNSPVSLLNNTLKNLNDTYDNLNNTTTTNNILQNKIRDIYELNYSSVNNDLNLEELNETNIINKVNQTSIMPHIPFNDKVNNSSMIYINDNLNKSKDYTLMLDNYISNNKNIDEEKVKQIREQLEALKNRENTLKDIIKKQEALKKENQDKERYLKNEKKKLEEKIQKLKKSNIEYEIKNKNLNENIENFDKELKDYYLKCSINENSNKIFYNLNYFLLTNKNISIDN